MSRVLLVRLSAMGDVVQSLGAVASLARDRPDLELHFCVQSGIAPLVRGLPLASVITFERRRGLRGLWNLRRRLRALGPDIALDLQGNWKSAVICWLSGARERIGARGAWRQEPRSAWLMTRTIAPAGVRHPAVVGHAIVRCLSPGVPWTLPRLRADASDIEAEGAALVGAGIDAAQPFRVIVPGNPADPRSLRPELLPAEVAASPHPVLFVLGPEESAVAPPGGAPVLRHGATELGRLIALGELLARAGGDALGPDQGPMHVLAAAGAATTVLFGPQDPRRTAPPGARRLVHREPPHCSPCGRRTCNHPEGPVCMAFPSDRGAEAGPIVGV